MGGGRELKNLSINGWVKRNCGVDLKIHSNIILVTQMILNKITKLPPFDPIPKNNQHVYSRNDTRYIFFYISMLVVSVIIGLSDKFFYVVHLYFEFKLIKNWSNWSKALLVFLFFFALNYKQL